MRKGLWAGVAAIALSGCLSDPPAPPPVLPYPLVPAGTYNVSVNHLFDAAGSDTTLNVDSNYLDKLVISNSQDSVVAGLLKMSGSVKLGYVGTFNDTALYQPPDTTLTSRYVLKWDLVSGKLVYQIKTNNSQGNLVITSRRL